MNWANSLPSKFSSEATDIRHIESLSLSLGHKSYLVDENMAPIQELQVGETFDDNGYIRGVPA